MNSIDHVTAENFTLYAAKHYFNPVCTQTEEFNNDLLIFKYIKRLLNRYQNSGEIPERLVLNHLITVCNVFGIEPALKMLEHKMDDHHWPALKTMLLFLRIIPNTYYPGIELDANLVSKLRDVNKSIDEVE